MSNFRKAKYALNSAIYFPHASYSNKIPLYKTVLLLVLLYTCPVMAFGCKTKIDSLQTTQNEII